MKKLILLPLLAALGCASSFAQGPSPSGTPAAASSPASVPASPIASLLTPDERQKLMAASQKAQHDPDVLAAAGKLTDAVKAASGVMVAKDPALSPILDKVTAASSPGAPRPQLTAFEIGKLRAGRESIAGTPEADAWIKATADYRNAVHKAMLAADPTLSVIFDKLAQPRPVTDPSTPTASPVAQ